MLGRREIRVDAVMFFHYFLGIRPGFDHGQFINGLGIIRYGTEAVNSDGHRAHAEETEGDETEGKDRGCELEGCRHDFHDGRRHRHEIGDKHEEQNGQAFPEGGEVTGDQSGENVKGSAALAGGVDDLFAVTGAGACEYLRKFGNQGAGDGPATDDGREGHPERHAAYVRQIGEKNIARGKGHDDGHDGGDPD